MDSEDFLGLVLDIPSVKAHPIDIPIVAVHTVWSVMGALHQSIGFGLDILLAHRNALLDDREFAREAGFEIERLTSPPKE